VGSSRAWGRLSSEGRSQGGLLQQPPQGIGNEEQPVEEQHPAIKWLMQRSPPLLPGGEPTPAFGLDLAVAGGYNREVHDQSPLITGAGSHPRSRRALYQVSPLPSDVPDMEARSHPIRSPPITMKSASTGVNED
jgi:hypothetical protein